jgi:hypothetical protein
MELMKTHNREQPKELSDAEFEGALHAALRDAGNLFPRNAEDVALLKASMDMNDVPTPDTQKFRQLLRQMAKNDDALTQDTKNIHQLFRRTAEKVTKIFGTDWLGSCEVEENLEKLAMAARNGGEMTDEIRKRMDTDRLKAKEQIQKKNGAH